MIEFNKIFINSMNIYIITDGVPQEICMYDIQCLNFCQKYGYNKGFCQTRWSSQLSKIQRNCYCHECDQLKCMSFCYKKKLSFTGCMCYNLLIPGGPLFGIYNKHNLNDCSDDKLFCQCGK